MAGDKLPKGETDKRVNQCYTFRFNNTNTFGHKHWIKYCKENYNDKSEQQYTAYWMTAGDIYKETWKTKLENLLEPAVDELYVLLSSEDEKIRQRALDQIMKYNGEDIQRIQAEIKGNIKVSFGED